MCSSLKESQYTSVCGAQGSTHLLGIRIRPVQESHLPYDYEMDEFIQAPWGQRFSHLASLLSVCLNSSYTEWVSMYVCTLEHPILIHGACILDYSFGAVFMRLEGQ